NINFAYEPRFQEEAYPFSDCSSLTHFSVAPTNPAYSGLDGVLLSKAQDCLLLCPAGKSGGYNVPGSITSIGAFAFRGCAGLTNVVIPNSVTNIGVRAFMECSGLTRVTIPDSVTELGSYVFGWCAMLTNVTIGKGLTTIAPLTFGYCTGLHQITLP